MYNSVVKKTKKICVITCYKHPDYVRGEVLAEAIAHNSDYELVRIKNKHKGLFRYPEIILKLIWARASQRPDVYILTFRGYEVLPFVRLISIGKKLIFDEFINPIEWTFNEHKKVSHSWLLGLSKAFYRLILRSVRVVMTDTDAHAKLSSELMGLPQTKFYTVPVGTDEKLFRHTKTSGKRKIFEVFFYGNMLPLHGMKYMLGAIKILLAENDLPELHITLIGGRGNKTMVSMVNEFIETNGLTDRVTYLEWADYKKLPEYIAKADLCLGGPFGNTPQSSRVITGKTFQFLAMGRPVLIGKTEESEIFEDKKNCIIVKQGSAQAIADGISWAYNNKLKLTSIGNNGRELFVNNFSVKSISQVLAKIL